MILKLLTIGSYESWSTGHLHINECPFKSFYQASSHNAQGLYTPDKSFCILKYPVVVCSDINGRDAIYVNQKVCQSGRGEQPQIQSWLQRLVVWRGRKKN